MIKPTSASSVSAPVTSVYLHLYSFCLFAFAFLSWNVSCLPFRSNKIDWKLKNLKGQDNHFLPNYPLNWLGKECQPISWKTPQQSMLSLTHSIMNTTRSAAALQFTLPHLFSPPVFQPDSCFFVNLERQD